MSSENQVKRLTADDIVVPEEMWRAVFRKIYDNDIPAPTSTGYRSIAAALLWLSENPIVPSMEQWRQSFHEASLRADGRQRSTFDWEILTVIEWQRRMFRKKQDALPDEVKKLIEKPFDNTSFSAMFADRIVAAYKLGKEGK